MYIYIYVYTRINTQYLYIYIYVYICKKRLHTFNIYIYICMYIFNMHVNKYIINIHIYIYVYRVKAGGSPEWNYMLLKWNLKMFILHWFLQCFMALHQFIGALKVSDVARTNSEFVRAEKQ